MRSAVSVILSSPAPDPNMSRPDYDQTIHDHAALLILVRHLGNYFAGYLLLVCKLANYLLVFRRRTNCKKFSSNL